MSDKKRPPAGVKPRWIHEEQTIDGRIVELAGAINRYVKAGMKVNKEWIDEYNELQELAKAREKAAQDRKTIEGGGILIHQGNNNGEVCYLRNCAMWRYSNTITGTEDTANVKREVYHTVEITESDMEALRRIKNYFGENDKSQLEHMAYDVLNRIT